MNIFLKLYYSIVHSEFWFHLYYKHTKGWKKQLADVKANAAAFRNRCEAEETDNSSN